MSVALPPAPSEPVKWGTEEYYEEWISDFTSGADFLAASPADPDWIVRGLILPGSDMVLYGREGTGKSRLIYQLANALQTGEGWCGFEVCETGPTLLLELDMAPAELWTMVRSAEQEGIESEEIIVPTNHGVLNVLDEEAQEFLYRLNEEFDPLLVIVDTATDSYLTDGMATNELVRGVRRAFRGAFPDSGLVFINHERKRSQYAQAKGVEDVDALLGPGEWSRKSSSVLQLVGINETDAKLRVHKMRQKKPFEELRLKRTENGFFEIDTAALSDFSGSQILSVFLGLPGVNGRDTFESVSEVCRIAGEISGKNPDSLRRAYQRAGKGVVFPWEEMVETLG